MTFDTAVLVLLFACFACQAMYGVFLLRQPPVESSRPVQVRLAFMQRRIDELLALARAAEVTLNGYDDRLADLQEARDAE